MVGLIKDQFFDESSRITLDELLQLNGTSTTPAAAASAAARVDVTLNNHSSEQLYANIAPPSIRWNDAFASLNFLLLNELPSEWTPVSILHGQRAAASIEGLSF